MPISFSPTRKPLAMKILQGFIPLVILIGLTSCEKKTKKHDKAGVKRDVGYGLGSIPAVAAIHAPLADENTLLALGRTAAHGGYASVVQPVGIIHNAPPVDNIGGFTSHGFDALRGGFGVYAAPHAIIATPLVNVQSTIPKAVQLDQGWKGIESGHGSIKHGHEIAQSLVAKPLVHDNIYEVAPLSPLVQYDYNRGKHGYAHNNLIPTYSSDYASGKTYAPVQHIKTHSSPTFFTSHQPVHHVPSVSFIQGTPAPKGYSFATYHATQSPQYGHGYGYATHSGLALQNSASFDGAIAPPNHGHGHNIHQKVHSNHKGHGSISHGHQIAKTVHTSSPSFGVQNAHHGKNHNSGSKYHHSTYNNHGAHSNAVHGTTYGHKKFASVNKGHHHQIPHTYHAPSTHGSSYSSHIPSGPSRVSAPLNSAEYVGSHDSTSHASSPYTSDYNNNSPSDGSSDNGDVSYSPSGHTNGHGGSQKATSFQSFVIHSYKPHATGKKNDYQNDSYESDENYSATNYNSNPNQSSESNVKK